MSYGRTYALLNNAPIKSCTTRGVDRRIRAYTAGLGGTLHQTMQSGIRTAPMATLTTTDLAAILAILDNDECPMVKLDESHGAVFAWPSGNPDGPGDDDAGHRSETILKGQAYLDSISWSSGGVVEAVSTILGTCSDGTTDPAQTNLSATLPGAVYPDIAHTLIGFTVDGDDIEELRRMDLRIGHGARNDDEGACYLKGKPHPTKVLAPGAGGQIAFELTFEMLNIGAAPTLGNIVATFQPQTPGAIGTSGSDVVLTMVPGLIIPVGPTDGNPSSITYRCLLKHDGTHRPLTVS